MINVLSLFDGMSCGQLALRQSGISYSKYYASELDKYAIAVTQANFPDTQQMGDVAGWKDWNIDWSSIDLLIGGSPCQGFSFAGKQLAFDDPRSKLFFVYIDILNHIQSVNPDVQFLLENVKMKKEHLDVISEYSGVEPVFINSALVSAQNRQRYYWASWNIEQPKDKGILLADVLEGEGTGWIKNKGEWHSRDVKGMCLDANYFKGVDNHGQRTMIKCGSMIGRRIDPVTGKRADDRRDIKPIQRIEIREDDKTGTITTVQKDNLVIMQTIRALKGAQYRKLTPIECERLQTVPDNYTNHVSNSQRYKMLGNGWTVDVITHILNQSPFEKLSFL